jgi:hypothetical protein
MGSPELASEQVFMGAWSRRRGEAQEAPVLAVSVTVARKNADGGARSTLRVSTSREPLQKCLLDERLDREAEAEFAEHHGCWLASSLAASRPGCRHGAVKSRSRWSHSRRARAVFLGREL